MIITYTWILVPQYYILVIRPTLSGDSPGTCTWQTKPAYLNPYTHMLEVI